MTNQVILSKYQISTPLSSYKEIVSKVSLYNIIEAVDIENTFVI